MRKKGGHEHPGYVSKKGARPPIPHKKTNRVGGNGERGTMGKKKKGRNKGGERKKKLAHPKKAGSGLPNWGKIKRTPQKKGGRGSWGSEL